MSIHEEEKIGSKPKTKAIPKKEETEENKIDVEFLKKIKEKLEKNNNLIIDEFTKNLDVVKLKEMP